MKRDAVTLSRHTVRKANGRTYTYWVLRWFSPDGKKHGQVLGSINALSKRQAEKLRRKKEAELTANPGRRNVSGTSSLPTSCVPQSSLAASNKV